MLLELIKFRCERCETYVEVLDVELGMLGKVEVLLGHEDTLTEEGLVDLLAVGLGDKPVKNLKSTSRTKIVDDS